MFVCLFVFLQITAPRPFDGRPVELLFVLTGTRRQILHPHPYPHLHLHPHLHPWSQAQICYGLVVAKNSLFSIKMCVCVCACVLGDFKRSGFVSPPPAGASLGSSSKRPCVVVTSTLFPPSKRRAALLPRATKRRQLRSRLCVCPRLQMGPLLSRGGHIGEVGRRV